MIESLPSTFMGSQKWPPKPGDIRFLSPSLARLHFFFAEDSAASPPTFPPNRVSQVAPKRVESMTLKTDGSLEQVKKILFISRRSHLRHWFYQPQAFLFFY